MGKETILFNSEEKIDLKKMLPRFCISWQIN